jgi:hypothetical protein
MATKHKYFDSFGYTPELENAVNAAIAGDKNKVKKYLDSLYTNSGGIPFTTKVKALDTAIKKLRVADEKAANILQAGKAGSL